MAGKKRKLQKAAAAGSGKERHKRAGKPRLDTNVPIPAGLEARLPRPQTTGKHHSYFEFVPNAEKKKKLDYQVTTDQKPPPGFAFIPIGDPQLTTACKELSREKGAMIFIVSASGNTDPNQLSHHIHRTGHHIRDSIVEEAKSTLSHLARPRATVSNGKPEPLPESQDEYTKQVNGVIRDLFPRIPHTDRQAIIVHAFNLSMRHHDPKPVGLCEDLPLSRRVQLAVLAHIRHTHTRYDLLLRETRWEYARRVVEQLCLDIIVRWRGDEETGRDQLDEILREVVVISDSEDEDSDDSNDGLVESSSGDAHEISRSRVDTPNDPAVRRPSPNHAGSRPPQGTEHPPEGEIDARTLHERIASRNEQRGFKRYRAWELALQRNRGQKEEPQLIGQGQARTVQDARAAVITEEALPAAAFAGSVPNSNGFVPPQSHWSQPIQPQAASHSGHAAMPLHGQTLSTSDGRASWTPVVRQVSPSTHRLEDMLVRSIEPASPDTPNHTSSSTRPQHSFAELSSPSRHGVPYRPVQGHDPRAWNIPGPIERPLMSERIHPDASSSRSRPVGFSLDHKPGHGYMPQFNDSANSRLRSPVPFPHPQIAGMSNMTNRTVVMNAPRPGERSNPIFMEDRGGFFERVQTPSNGARHYDPATPERPHQWSSQGSHWTSGTARGGMWDQTSRPMGMGRGDPDIEMTAPHRPPLVAAFSSGSGFDSGVAGYALPAQSSVSHEAGCDHLSRTVHGHGPAPATSTYNDGFEHHRAAALHTGHRTHETSPHSRQPVYRHYQNDQTTMGAPQYGRSVATPRRSGSLIVID